MALARVVVSPSSLLACLGHALTTEKEEIMGLLLGAYTEGPLAGETEAHVWDIFLLTRTDRQSDRVEVSPEQLVEANEAAEALGQRIGAKTNVIGWYHSHPKITVLPSHVDVRTQAQNQMMDDRFFGLIVACFYRGPDLLHKVQLTAFQSVPSPAGGMERSHTPVWVRATGPVTADPMQTFARLPEILYEEERATYEKSVAAAPAKAAGLPSQLVHLNAGAVYTRALTGLLDKVTVAIIEMLEQRQARILDQIERLQRRRAELEADERGLF